MESSPAGINFQTAATAALERCKRGIVLPFSFDPLRLQSDLERVSPQEWAPHYNEADYGGRWRGVALRSRSGTTGDLAAWQGGSGCFADTPLLDRCPYLRQALAAFPCPLQSVRLLALAPGSFIREHRDPGLNRDNGEARLHIPIQTSTSAEFYVAGERLLLEEGRCYYVNVSLPHRVDNRGDRERIHLVIDAVVDDWLADLFSRAEGEDWHIPHCEAPPLGFAEFRERVFESPELRDELRRIGERGNLIARAVEMGRQLGFQFNLADVGACFGGAPAGSAATAEGWTPVKVSFPGGEPVAEWIYTGSLRFTEPFFQDSARLAKRNPFTALFRREMPLDAAESLDALAPTGFIFHMSRCGSTLIAQMLASLDRCVVISEAAPVDEVLQAGLLVADLPRKRQVRWLRQVVAALGQRPRGTESLYFLKLDSWHIHHMALIREAFPGVPWIFVHRRLEDVVASQLRQPGLPGAPGALDPRILGLCFEDIVTLDREQWCRRVLSGFLDAAAGFRSDPSGMFVDYSQLPEAVWGGIGSHFGVLFSEAEIKQMREAARFDAKNPRQPFQPSPAAGDGNPPRPSASNNLPVSGVCASD